MRPADAADVAIVGAGPAGCRAAWRLARAGARVVLFDHSHPREKPCGGGVTGRALGLVADAVPVGTLPGVPVGRAVFVDPNAARADVALEDAGMDAASSLLVTDRQAFDGALLAAALEAGVEVVAERVADVEAGDGPVVVRTAARTCRASFVVGADGANSLVRRRCARPFSRAQLSIATGFYARGATSREIVIEFVADPPGYIWSFPRPDHLAIGICAPADVSAVEPLRRRVAHWTERFPGARGTRLDPYSWPIPSLRPQDCLTERPAGDRWALLGDAAGLVDPITREGIFFALHSANLLASALSASAPAAGSRYVEALRAQVFPELWHAASLARGFFRSGFTRLLVEALRESPRVNGIMRDLVAGRQPYATLKRRLIATFEIGLAWRLLMLEIRGRRRQIDPLRHRVAPSA